ncbi:MAG: hypothetical protein QXR79_03945, partial [Candidatus Bathyarchaeia archaeon]
NFAPFYEIGVGAYLDGRKRAQWLIPLLLFTLLYNIPIRTKALIDLLFSKITKKNNNHWAKTEHSGNGNCYIMNCIKPFRKVENGSGFGFNVGCNVVFWSYNLHHNYASASNYGA